MDGATEAAPNGSGSSELEELEGLEIEDAAADTLGGVELHVGLGGQVVAKDTNALPIRSST